MNKRELIKGAVATVAAASLPALPALAVPNPDPKWFNVKFRYDTFEFMSDDVREYMGNLALRVLERHDNKGTIEVVYATAHNSIDGNFSQFFKTYHTSETGEVTEDYFAHFHWPSRKLNVEFVINDKLAADK